MRNENCNWKNEQQRQPDGAERDSQRMMPRRVLLAEDGLVAQRVVVEFLESRGHSVMVANHGREAIGQFTQQPFDVVLLDLQMPVMDGIEAAQVIRGQQSPAGDPVRIIAMTASVNHNELARCPAAGMDGYLFKPFKAAELYQAVESTTNSKLDGLSMSSETRILNWPAAVERMMGREDMLRRLAQAFLDDSSALMAGVDLALKNREYPQLSSAANALRGLADILCARTTADAVRRLERATEHLDAGAMRDAWSDLQDEIQELLPTLAALVKS